MSFSILYLSRSYQNIIHMSSYVSINFIKYFCLLRQTLSLHEYLTRENDIIKINRLIPSYFRIPVDSNSNVE